MIGGMPIADIMHSSHVKLLVSDPLVAFYDVHKTSVSTEILLSALKHKRDNIFLMLSFRVFLIIKIV
jgi:hypothetical protein